MSEADRHDFTLDDRGDFAVVRLEGPKVPPEIGAPLYRLVQEGRNRLLLDFRKVQYLSSNGIAILVTLKKHVDAAGGIMVLCHLEPALKELLKLTHLDHLIPVYPGERDALGAF